MIEIFHVGGRVTCARSQQDGVVAEIPADRGYVFVQWDDAPPGNLSGEWPSDITRSREDDPA